VGAGAAEAEANQRKRAGAGASRLKPPPTAKKHPVPYSNFARMAEAESAEEVIDAAIERSSSSR
jgi:hypothetical protein